MLKRGNVLVTGGGGYIGSHVCKALFEARYQPVTVDNFCRGHRWAAKWGPFIEGDICDRMVLDRVILQHNPIAVIHLAGFAYVGESVRRPDLYYQNNVVGSLRLLECLRHHGLKKIVFSSSCATYGEPTGLPIDESHQRVPVNPYGRTKLIVENMLHDYAQAFGIHSVSLRYFNAAGADADGEIGECHDPETHLIPLLLQVALGERSEIEVFGRDYDTHDGTCIRDYVHVSDLADAHVRSLEALVSAGLGAHAYNLGTGKGHSVQQVIDAVQEVTGRQITVVDASRRSGDPAELVADSTRANHRLEWEPKFTDIRDIISTAWHWAQLRHENGSGYEGKVPPHIVDLTDIEPNPFL